MGRKMDALLRRGFRASKFKILAKLAISRLAILKNQRQARCSTARSDVIQLLNMGQQDRAKQRVELVVKEQNMLDVFAMMEDFIGLLTERIALLQDNKECPDELEEAVSSLIFAATRCGEFPELKHIRETFTSRFGKDFAARAAELRNNCKVNPKIIQKLSTRQPNLENRLKVLKEIASESGITLDLEEKQDEQKQTMPHESFNVYKPEAGDEINNLAEMLSESIKARKFKGVAAAAQEAFEAAAYAAAAARAALELSRADSHDTDPDVYEHQQLVAYEPTPEAIVDGYAAPEEINNSESGSSSNKIHPNEACVDGYAAPEEINHSEDGLSSTKIHPNDNSSSEAEDEEEVEAESYYSFKNMGESINKTEIEITVSASSTDSDSNTEKETTMAPNLPSQTEQCNDDVVVSESDNEATENQKSIEELEHHGLAIIELQYTKQNKDSDDESNELPHMKSQVESTDHPMDRKSRFESTQSFSDFGQKLCAQHSGIDRKFLSVRTIPVLRG